MTTCCCTPPADSTTSTTPSPSLLSAPRIYVNEVGHAFILTFVDGEGNAVDLTNAQDVHLSLEGPDGDVADIDVTPQVDVDESDGILTYATVAEDLGQPGRWRYQGVATVDAGSPPEETIYRTPVVGVNVYPNLT